MSIQGKLRELIRRDERVYGGHKDAVQSNKTPEPGHPTGAPGGDESPSADRSPVIPVDDGAPLGDTDQHSQAYRPRE